MTVQIETHQEEQPPDPKGFSIKQVIAMVLGSMVIAIIATFFAVKLFLFPAPFKPVELSDKEERHLEEKIARFEGFQAASSSATQFSQPDIKSESPMEPEKYSEEGASRQIQFTERELNAMVAKNTDLADKLAIDLAQDTVSLKLLLPMDPDFPMLGGKTLRIHAGAELAYKNGRPVVKLKGISVMGVPMPNGWLGGIKNIDLVSEFGADEGFWKSFADGVESIAVVEQNLQIQLKE